MTKAGNRDAEQAASQYSSIVQMVGALSVDYERLEELKDSDDEDLSAIEMEERDELQEAAGDCESEDEAREAINDDPLSIEVRSGWYTPGSGDNAPSEFCILLCTGGSAVRIVGELDEHLQPARAWLEYQDWGTSWTRYFDADQSILLTYCQQFYFGE